jgi:hypothetical protein
MQRLEVSCAVRPIYGSLGAKGLNTFHLGYKNQPTFDVNSTGHCLYLDKYKTHKYSVGRAYSCLNIQLVGASRYQ